MAEEVCPRTVEIVRKEMIERLSSYISRKRPELGPLVAGILIVVLALAGCSTPKPANMEEENSSTLVRVAQKFNDDYREGNFGSVYDRWNAQSQAIIRRSDYIRRHVECPNNPQAPVHVLSARRGVGDTWLVSYTISDLNFTDYWSYSEGSWQFDLLKSNPAAAKLYRLPVAEYVLNLGCVRS